MKVKYKNISCDVSFIKGLRVNLIKIKLRFIRGLRLLQRLLSYAKPLIIVVICLLLYITLLFFINYENRYSTIFDAIWNVRNTIFTVLFLSYFVNASTRERIYRSRIRLRHTAYCNVMFGYRDCIVNTLKLLGPIEFELQCLYTHQSILRVYKHIDILKTSAESYSLFENNIPRIIEYVSRIKEITRMLTATKDLFNLTWDSSRDGEMFNYRVESLPSSVERLIDKLKYEKINATHYTEFLKELRHIIYGIEYIVEHTRKPWRIDIKNHVSILELIYPSNKEKLEKSYYISALFDLKNKKSP